MAGADGQNPKRKLREPPGSKKALQAHFKHHPRTGVDLTLWGLRLPEDDPVAKDFRTSRVDTRGSWVLLEPYFGLWALEGKDISQNLPWGRCLLHLTPSLLWLLVQLVRP